MRIISWFSRIVLGVVFLFSGFVKAVDPLGSAYKLGDYFSAFRLDFLDGLSLPLSILLSSFELVLGLLLIIGYQKRMVYWATLVFMSFFTVLTFILALLNPVTDCGCFGDAIIMTNWETFFKNVVLMVFVLLLFRSRGRTENCHSDLIERALIIVFFSGCFLFSWMNLRNLPLLDFRPYDLGTDIRSEMEIPPDAPVYEYETTLIYRNLETGEESDFTIENYPQDTSLWEFVNSESTLIRKGYEPPIHDFGISDADGLDITDQVLDYHDYTLLMVTHDLEKANASALSAANEWEELQYVASGFSFLPVTASSTSKSERITDSLGLEYDFASADEIMLKTVVRSNPGFVLLKNGIIIGKWSWQTLPELSSWNPEWPDKVSQGITEQDPEIMLMIEEGILEQIAWDVIDFDQSAQSVISTSGSKKSEGRVWLIYMLSLAMVILLINQIPKK